MKLKLTGLCASLAFSLPGLVFAQNAADLPCRTTEECQAQAAKIRGNISKGATSAQAQAEDQFFWLNKVNKASAIMLYEQGIIPEELIGKLAHGVQHAIDQAKKAGGKRPTDVLQLEKIIMEVVGPEASLIHTGRSRQDMNMTIQQARLRLAILDFNDSINVVRSKLLAVAAKNVETFVPAYTNGVQAMPISYAHYLLAYADSFARDSDRIAEAYKRINRSSLGAAVLANSSWPLSRPRLAELLGFDSPIINSLDSNQVSFYDIPIEATNIAGSTAIRVGAMMQDFHTQYHQTRPWLLLAPGKTYTSSAMPQKRNPGILQNTRGKATDVLASSQHVELRAHNVSTGMNDYKRAWDIDSAKTFVLGVEMMTATADTLDALRIDKKRSLEELNNEWTTSMELAEALQHQHKVPFRIGHHFASEIVQYARNHELVPATFPYQEAVRIYAEAGKKYDWKDSQLPLDEAAFRKTLSAENMVRTRVGLGGPQPEEVSRMLVEAQKKLTADQAWANAKRVQLANADAQLNNEFAKLMAKK